MRSAIRRVCSLRVSTAVLVLVPTLEMVLMFTPVVVPVVADVSLVGAVVAITVVGVVVRVIGVVVAPATVIPVAEADSPRVIPARIVGAEMAANTKTARTIPARDRDTRDDPPPIGTRVHRASASRCGWIAFGVFGVRLDPAAVRLTTRGPVDDFFATVDDRVDRVFAADLALGAFMGCNGCECAFGPGVWIHPGGRFVGSGIFEGLLGGSFER